MPKRLTIDPITRIEGHLRIDVEIDGGRVADAWASCTMWRGIENILKNRDAREAWLFAQRFCGVCTTVHAIASVRCIENALELEVPKNAQYIRNLILIAHGLHDHIVHFYHLSALDWVDITTILDADPKAASAVAESLSDWSGNSPKAYEAIKKRVAGLVESGQLGIFAHGYWGHPAMKLSPEVNLIATAHYFQALDFQRKANQVVAILGAKTPHIQNLAVGGVMNAINLDSVGALNLDKIEQARGLLQESVDFVHNVYFPDACVIAGFYPEWFGYGRGVDNYLAVPDLPTDGLATNYDLPGGSILGGKLDGVVSIDGFRDEGFRANVTEDVTHAWYEGGGPLHPFKGKTDPEYTDFQADGKYTWVKAPRYGGAPMQVGPLATILIGYAKGDPLTVKWTDKALELVSGLAKRRVTVKDLRSTMGRYLARAIRAAILGELALKHMDLFTQNVLGGDTTSFNPPSFPESAVEGVGMHEAPRGTLSHWAVVKGGRLENYQAVVPTTWNASPRDENGVRGPYEAALVNNPVADPEKPLEVLRTVHSFDPCMACACHTFDPNGRELAYVKVL